MTTLYESAIPTPPAAPSPKKNSYRPFILITTLIVGLVAFAAFMAQAQSGSTPETFTMSGTLSLYQDTYDPNYTVSGGSCKGIGGYSDINYGANIQVHDGADVLIASSQLGYGTSSGWSCDFSWSVPNVPIGSMFQLKISHRNEMSYPLAEARLPIGLALGNN